MGLLFTLVSVRVKGVYFAMITLAVAEALYILSKASDFVKWTGADEGLQAYPSRIGSTRPNTACSFTSWPWASW